MCLWAFDVEKDGKRRLWQVAKACESRGNRVQQSVFECLLDEKEFEVLRARLFSIIALEFDSLRIYTLGSRRDHAVEIHGVDHTVDYTDALIF